MSGFDPAAITLILAGLADALIGDPWDWPHPVRVMGTAIAMYSQWSLQRFFSPRQQRFAGIVLGLVMVVGSGAIAGGLIYLSLQTARLLGMGLAVILLASCFAQRSLSDAARDVLQPLERGDLETARSHLARYVGRDTEKLDPADILRAVLETVSENATDGVMAPLFYALLGALISPVYSVAFAIAYKAASTLDSMVGYRELPYRYLGWFSARLEDTLTWLPCRLTVATVALQSGQPLQVWRLCLRDAAADPSPNAGWSECAYAAALQVQLGGVNRYGGVVKVKPYLGDASRKITPAAIAEALRLTRNSFWLWLILGVILLWLR
ncbi:MAG: cobalamin biosynthesis protein [Leptolyngbyaceae cyanobacterium SM1_1_3]|nr:cobalamin biosynthesis protein [Leptolyngbyaceae cyanobacterium SM1_1_3]NJN04854.1 cobalamin biosynthesis protein [Leptolyngbyaceae cyanobacterium RM1_1_2]NJO09982.1 cobalamin biosynthesis protein [Leptolyngbyaceae cyanobacterium SL_1_1]